MVWLPTQADPLVLFAWCTLTGDIGKPLMGLAGFGGLIGTLRSLSTLPAIATTHIVTVRNKRRRYRRNTIILGCIVFTMFVSSIATYLCSTSLLRAVGKVCEMDQPPHTAVTATLPFLLTTIAALLLFGWFQIRILQLKKYGT
jgi:hypothetical protein